MPEASREREFRDDAERWLTPGVGGIGAASFLADVGHEVATALLPSLLVSALFSRLRTRQHLQVGLLGCRGGLAAAWT